MAQGTMARWPKCKSGLGQYRRHKWNANTSICERCKRHRNPKAKSLIRRMIDSDIIGTLREA